MNWRCAILGHAKRVDAEDHSAHPTSRFAFQTWIMSCTRPGCDWAHRVRESRLFMPMDSKETP